FFRPNSRSKKLREFSLARGKDILVKRVAMSVDGDYRREIGDLEFPDGFRCSEFLQEVNTGHFFHAIRQDLGGAADGVQINAPMLFARGESSVAHAALADHRAKAEITNDLALVRFLADRRGGACGKAFPGAVRSLDNDWSAVVQNAAL